MTRFYHGDDRAEQAARRHNARTRAIALGDLFAELGLAHLEIGQRAGRPRLAFRAARHLIQAAAWYAEAGLGRRADAIGRLLERCRRAWDRHEARGGFV